MIALVDKIKPAFQWKAFSSKGFTSLEKNLHIYLQRWFLNSFEILIQPLLYFLAFGFGLEKWVSKIDNLLYHEYVFFGVIAATAMSTALYESSQSVFERYLTGKSFLLIRTCPVRFEEALFGEWLWSVFRSVLACSLMLLVGASIDVVYAVDFMPILFTCFWLAVVFSSVGMWVASRVDSFAKCFQYSSMIVIPILLFSGVFFPTERLPDWLRFIMDILPLSLGVEWIRTNTFSGNFVMSTIQMSIYLVLSVLLFNWSASKIADRLEENTEAKM